jgi:putative methionine-R-sulfoxide reductase with GAF domain
MDLSLDAIRSCLEGVVPSTICTAAPDGTPNVTYLSIVQYVDPTHVALSFQFFNKSRANIERNPRAQLLVIDPVTFGQYRLDLLFERSELSGPLFDRMNTRLTAIASLTGMSRVFKLRGADIYRVLACTCIPVDDDAETEAHTDDAASAPLPPPPSLESIARVTEALSACADLDALVTAAIRGLRDVMGYEHVVLLLADETGERLLAVDSGGGTAGSGAGAEIAVGEGVWGTAAAQQRPIRISRLARDMRYSDAVRRTVQESADASTLEKQIPWPGLAEVDSLLAVPLVLQGELVGLLGLESTRTMRFRHEDEAAVQVVARQLALMVGALAAPEDEGPRSAARTRTPAQGRAVRFRHHADDDSVFIDDRYVIKGLSGRILARLVRIFVNDGRTDFSNKELRTDATLKLSTLRDNLETRLLLLRRRLDDRAAPIRLLRTGRGQLRLQVEGVVAVTTIE